MRRLGLTGGLSWEGTRLYHDAIIEADRAQGADSVILGCTEIGLLATAENSPLPVYETMALHSVAPADVILDGAPSA